MRWLCLLLWLLPLPVAAEERVVAALSQDTVSISTSFDGSEILIFGAVKRSSPPPDAAPLRVVITVAGPDEPVVVRRKERRFGIWVNTEAVEVDAAPSFYAVASSAPLDEAISAVEDQRWRITTPRALRAVGVSDATDDVPAFLDALIRVRRAEDLYVSAPETVVLDQETLFSTTIALPSDLTEGDYVTRIFLTRDRQVIDRYETTIFVQKVGLERFIYNLAHEQPLIYGILSLVIAIAAGWLASAVFRYIRT
ncbi:TIGR02186 family protein [Jannaschia ovalis]|uniref:TIGR02186 family protein n=1 Tax=Jannaschia ovalis TaxID=3038773 RepID=A0ABY8LFI1_9RHOB|nr:TIGR02186 family protein [Jannaschia sp. GRR-S6-38]WGH80059.1 TIGR02186 family protein [Jannaschia sp. GRR-S6-38]